MDEIKVYKRKQMKNGIIIQLRHKQTGKSKSFTIQTNKSLEYIEDAVFEYLSSLGKQNNGNK